MKKIIFFVLAVLCVLNSCRMDQVIDAEIVDETAGNVVVMLANEDGSPIMNQKVELTILMPQTEYNYGDYRTIYVRQTFDIQRTNESGEVEFTNISSENDVFVEIENVTVGGKNYNINKQISIKVGETNEIEIKPTEFVGDVIISAHENISSEDYKNKPLTNTTLYLVTFKNYVNFLNKRTDLVMEDINEYIVASGVTGEKGVVEFNDLAVNSYVIYYSDQDGQLQKYLPRSVSYEYTTSPYLSVLKSQTTEFEMFIAHTKLNVTFSKNEDGSSSPFSGVSVYLLQDYYSSSVLSSLEYVKANAVGVEETNGNGECSFSNLTPGRYIVVYYKDKKFLTYYNSAYVNYGEETDISTSYTPISLYFSLIKKSSESSEAYKDVTVYLTTGYNSNLAHVRSTAIDSTITNSSGECDFEDLPEGYGYYLIYQKGEKIIGTYGDFSLRSGQKKTISDIISTQNIDVTLTHNNGGEAYEGVSVLLIESGIYHSSETLSQYKAAAMRSLDTDAQGKVTFTEVSTSSHYYLVYYKDDKIIDRYGSFGVSESYGATIADAIDFSSIMVTLKNVENGLYVPQQGLEVLLVENSSSTSEGSASYYRTIALTSLTSDAEGQVVFTDVNAMTYRVVVIKDDKVILNQYEYVSNGEAASITKLFYLTDVSLTLYDRNIDGVKEGMKMFLVNSYDYNHGKTLSELKSLKITEIETTNASGEVEYSDVYSGNYYAVFYQEGVNSFGAESVYIYENNSDYSRTIYIN